VPLAPQETHFTADAGFAAVGRSGSPKKKLSEVKARSADFREV